MIVLDEPLYSVELATEIEHCLLSLDSFNTKAKRMGVVLLLRPTRIEFYRVDRKIETMNW